MGEVIARLAKETLLLEFHLRRVWTNNYKRNEEIHLDIIVDRMKREFKGG